MTRSIPSTLPLVLGQAGGQSDGAFDWLDPTANDGDGFQNRSRAYLQTLRQGFFLGNAIKRHEHAAIDEHRHQHGEAEADQAGCAV